MFPFQQVLFMEQYRYYLKMEELLNNYFERGQTPIRRLRRRYHPAVERQLNRILMRQIQCRHLLSSIYNEFATKPENVNSDMRPEPTVAEPYLTPGVRPNEEPQAHCSSSYGTATNEHDGMRGSDSDPLYCTCEFNQMMSNYKVINAYLTSSVSSNEESAAHFSHSYDTGTNEIGAMKPRNSTANSDAESTPSDYTCEFNKMMQQNYKIPDTANTQRRDDMSIFQEAGPSNAELPTTAPRSVPSCEPEWQGITAISSPSQVHKLPASTFRENINQNTETFPAVSTPSLEPEWHDVMAVSSTSQMGNRTSYPLSMSILEPDTPISSFTENTNQNTTTPIALSMPSLEPERNNIAEIPSSSRVKSTTPFSRSAGRTLKAKVNSIMTCPSSSQVKYTTASRQVSTMTSVEDDIAMTSPCNVKRSTPMRPPTVLVPKSRDRHTDNPIISSVDINDTTQQPTFPTLDFDEDVSGQL